MTMGLKERKNPSGTGDKEKGGNLENRKLSTKEKKDKKKSGKTIHKGGEVKNPCAAGGRSWLKKGGSECKKRLDRVCRGGGTGSGFQGGRSSKGWGLGLWGFQGTKIGEDRRSPDDGGYRRRKTRRVGRGKLPLKIKTKIKEGPKGVRHDHRGMEEFVRRP